ncbi:MAG: hypothetical protein IKM33_06860 [Clostridia bacterium]|nr:hypothetical protein [Clostridia bacterium]
MPLRKRKEPRDSQHYARGSTKKRTRRKRFIRPWQILVPSLCALAGIVLALVLGNYLQAKSDAYRENEGESDWLSPAETVESIPVPVPDIHAVRISPEGNVGDILMEGKHGGVILSLCDSAGVPLYASKVATAAGMAVSASAPSLTEDVDRISQRELNVTVVYTVTCFSTPDAAVSAYRRGLDLAFLRECAEARPGDILLLGLPHGSDTADKRAMEFLAELKALLADLPGAPAIGVALPPPAFASGGSDETSSDTPQYAGNLSPARLLTYCDYVAMDLRSMSAVGVATLLPDIRYAYARYSLRLLLNVGDQDAVNNTLSQGFKRVFEMEPSSAVGSNPDQEKIE